MSIDKSEQFSEFLRNASADELLALAERTASNSSVQLVDADDSTGEQDDE